MEISAFIGEDSVSLPPAQEQIGVRGGTRTAHRCAPELVVVAAIKYECIVGEGETEKIQHENVMGIQESTSCLEEGLCGP